ncbi:FAD-binding protein [Fretibacter rubidus]|uniref:FAD-binding protein n=1 Tax=Fretibacter rubidus TaxID=570162 RepID=UPI00352BCAD6
MDKNWHSSIEACEVVNDSADIPWDDRADVIVIGLGAAGVSCSLQALELGQSVIAIDRFDGGGATVASGGVIYAGGGTAPQLDAGIEDTPENMFNYLKMEVGDIIKDSTLMDFCEQSAPTISWMQSHGVDFRSDYWPNKTSYPAPEYFLYHSDNSLIESYKAKAKPAARGHRGYVPIEKGRKAQNLGGALFDPLLHSAIELGLKLKTYSEARQLVTDDSGKIIGVKILTFPDPAIQQEYQAMRKKAQRLMTIYPSVLPGFSYFMRKALKILAQAAALETQRSAHYIRANKGVLLSAGGFVFNRKMLKEHAPKYRRCFPLGTDGDDGAGIRLGQSAGGAVGNMDRATAWRFINPPLSFARGMIVNGQGQRFINEMVYGATLGVELAENQQGKAWLILDKEMVKRSMKDVSGKKALAFQKALAKLNVYFGSTKATTIEKLAEKIGIDGNALRNTLATYNAVGKGEISDDFGKGVDDIATLQSSPYYAIDIGLQAKLFPCPALTLGGLRVEETTGQVLTGDGQTLAGLYAAGRNAIGVASWNYVSGLSIADGIYSGRRAARAMARPNP